MSAINTNKREWTTLATRIVRIEMVRRNIKLKGLVSRLAQHQVTIDGRDLAARLCRGTFGATLLLQCLVAMDVEVIKLTDYEGIE